MEKTKEFNLSEKRTISFNGNLGDVEEYCYTETDIKEFIKRRTEKLIRIERYLCSNDTDDWDIALGMVRDLIKDKDKLAGEALSGEKFV